jgi:hypothetical protein
VPRAVDNHIRFYSVSPHSKPKADKVSVPNGEFRPVRMNIVDGAFGYFKCFATVTEALGSKTAERARDWINPQNTMAAEYKITETEITLDKINDPFKSAFYPWLLRSENKNLWNSTVNRRIE